MTQNDFKDLKKIVLAKWEWLRQELNPGLLSWCLIHQTMRESCGHMPKNNTIYKLNLDCIEVCNENSTCFLPHCTIDSHVLCMF